MPASCHGTVGFDTHTQPSSTSLTAAPGFLASNTSHDTKMNQGGHSNTPSKVGAPLAALCEIQQLAARPAV